MKIQALVFTLPCLLITSCYSVSSVKRYGINATLLDEQNASPVTRKAIEVTIDGETFAQKSSSKGKIRVKPDRQHHITWLGAPAIVYDLEANIRIDCEGYEPVILNWFRYFPERNGGKTEDRGEIQLGDIKLSPLSPKQ